MFARIRRTPYLLYGLAAAVALSAGCESTDDPLGVDDEDEPGGTEYKIVIENDSDLTIDEVYLNFCSLSGWGENDLPAGDVISPGRSASWTFPEAACIDIKVVSTTGAEATELGVQLAGLYTWTVDGGDGGVDDDGDDDDDNDDPGPADYGLTVNNYTSATVSEVYFSHCSDASWGGNKLPSPIGPNDNYTWTLSEGGCYDLKAVTTEGAEATRFGVEINGLFTWNLQP